MTRKFWQAAFAAIFLAGIYLFLPASEIAAARAWIAWMVGRIR